MHGLPTQPPLGPGIPPNIDSWGDTPAVGVYLQFWETISYTLFLFHSPAVQQEYLCKAMVFVSNLHMLAARGLSHDAAQICCIICMILGGENPPVQHVLLPSLKHLQPDSVRSSQSSMVASFVNAVYIFSKSKRILLPW